MDGKMNYDAMLKRTREEKPEQEQQEDQQED